MSSLSHLIAGSALKERIFSEHQLAAVLGGGEARRYGLVNRALKDGYADPAEAGDVQVGPRRARRGHAPVRRRPEPFPWKLRLIRKRLGPSWIPEAVHVTASILPGRKTQTFDTPEAGRFGFHPLALREYQFLVGVDRIPFVTLAASIAQPLRALMDLVALRKTNWSGLEWLVDGMRIDRERLLAIRRKDFTALRSVYKHQAANDFLHALETAVQDAGGAAGVIAA